MTEIEGGDERLVGFDRNLTGRLVANIITFMGGRAGVEMKREGLLFCGVLPESPGRNRLESRNQNSDDECAGQRLCL